MKKSDLVIPVVQPNIEVGTKVVFVDGSYTLSLVKGKLTHTCLGLSENIFEVIAINTPCPSDSEGYTKALRPQNNCIVYDESDDSYHFCSEINIRAIRGLGSKKPYTLKL